MTAILVSKIQELKKYRGEMKEEVYGGCKNRKKRRRLIRIPRFFAHGCLYYNKVQKKKAAHGGDRTRDPRLIRPVLYR